MSAKTKILLIDDEPLVREELGGILEDKGYEVITGADGEEGLALFASEMPDMVITDVRMPRRDGLSVALLIRQQSPTVPVTVITGHGTEAMAIEALRAGVTDFIKKPVRLEDLSAAIIRMEAARKPVEQDMPLPSSMALVERSWVYELRNDLGAVPAFVYALLERCCPSLDRRASLELGLALREIILNAMEHGNLGLSFADKSRALEQGTLDQLLRARASDRRYAHRRVRVIARLRDRTVSVSVSDQGDGFDWRNLADPLGAAQRLAAHGRGVLLARVSVDSLEYNEKGNEVTVVKNLD